MNNTLSVAPGQLQNIFKKYLPDENVLFVFSTDVVMNSWVDWCVCHEEESGVTAVPLERFVSWDKFKGQYASAEQKDKNVIWAKRPYEGNEGRDSIANRLTNVFSTRNNKIGWNKKTQFFIIEFFYFNS